MSKYALETIDVKKSFGQYEVLHGINLQFENNSFNSIIGQSGSGKSTLLNILGTLDKPTSGQVNIADQRVDVMTKKQLKQVRNHDLGFIFQFHYLLPEYTVMENVLMPVRIGGQKISDEIKARADELLDIVGLSQVKMKNATKISGGQAQRAAIARALINQPKLILADEPTGNLDSESTETVYNLLRSLNEQYNTTFVVITHDPGVAEKTDRIIEVKDGNIIKDFLT
ncbi:MAG: ABC transporter ATP-binding protein [Candidatus Heimdallarchaeota archaeon]|nr:ABC transporter ATP-binding protein [Candidatus Heimdallarchaeota archaeon]